jgi:hypothetical protein|tara:strand:+ start:2061 stop:2222 length:162 start_codon:yes stop_codon:yes gene_type:complete
MEEFFLVSLIIDIKNLDPSFKYMSLSELYDNGIITKREFDIYFDYLYSNHKEK